MIKEQTGLTLTLKPGEGVSIGDNILVEIPTRKGNKIITGQVRIRFFAPRGISIERLGYTEDEGIYENRQRK